MSERSITAGECRCSCNPRCGCDCHRPLYSDRIANLEGLLRGVLTAISAAQAVGCIVYLDCWDEREALWYAPIDRAKSVLGEVKP